MSSSSFIDRRAYIVDDEPALRNTIRRMLTATGILTEEFGSAEAFLEGYAGRPLGCVLLDIRLPGLSGVELLHRLGSKAIAHPVIMVSGHGDIPTAVGAVKAGAFDFIQKPFRKEELLRVVDSAFEIVARMQQSRSGNFDALSPRERDTLAAFAGGQSNKAVADKLGLSLRTVEMHRANIIRKLGVENLTQALFMAKDGGYLK